MRSIIMKYHFLFFLLFTLQHYAQDSLKLMYVLTGENSGDGFSIVEGLGDVNNDGYLDFAVGAFDSEYVKIYFGSSPFDTSNYLRIQIKGPWWDSRFGFPIAGRGDLNGDGINDFVISNSQYGDYQSGALYIYLGGDDLDTIPDYIIYGTRLNSLFGYSVSINGDINGDGYDDILVGAPAYHSDFYIFYGGEVISTSPDIHIVEELYDDFLGESVDIIGDLNNDGKDEFLVGASQAIFSDSGKAYLFYGGNFRTISFENSVKFYGPQEGSYFGRWVSNLGDLNGDGYLDFCIAGQHQFNIYLGNEVCVYENPFIILSNEEMEYESFANFASSFGDINQDGYTDFLVGLENSGDLYSGVVKIYFGESEFYPEPSIIINGNTDFSYLGFSSAFLGDINNDGSMEIAISELKHLPDAKYGEGKVYIYSFTSSTDVVNESPMIYDFKLEQNYPNPFNSETIIEYSIAKEDYVNIYLYSMLGEKLRTLESGFKNAGNYKIHLDTSNFSSGIYFYKMYCTGFVETKKMVLIR